MLTVEEKLAAVRRYERGQETAGAVAANIGVNTHTLRKWVYLVRGGKELHSSPEPEDEEARSDWPR